MTGTEGGGEATEQAAARAEGLQFDTVERPASAACARCKRPLSVEYFEARGAMLCSECGRALGGAGSDGASLLRSLVRGAGAAFVGSLAWILIRKLSGYELGIVAIGVGLLVGSAVRSGSGNRGGARYQALAIALTYLSITGSYVPLILHGHHRAAWPIVVAAALAMPFLLKNIIGLFIIGIALYEAWKINRALPVSGPFRIASAPPGSA